MKVILDIDGVLADTHLELLKRYNNEYRTNLTKSDLLHWDLTKVQKKGTDMIKHFHTPGFFANLPVYEGAKQGVAALASIRCVELFIASASTTVGFSEKEQWAKQNFPEIPKDNIIFAVRKDLLAGDIMVDDALHNIASSICTSTIIFNQPWNSNANLLRTNLFRANSWNDVVRIIYCLLQNRKVG